MTHERLNRRARSAALLPVLTLALLPLAACSGPADVATDAAPAVFAEDPHSYSAPERVAVTHLDLDVSVDFEARRITGRASLTLVRHDPEADAVVLDVHGLEIRAVSLDDGVPAEFTLGDADPTLGRSLTVRLTPRAQVVHVDYATSEDAGALLWMEPEQTAGGDQPFLFTQSQAILARTWVPCQDTPADRKSVV